MLRWGRALQHSMGGGICVISLQLLGATSAVRASVSAFWEGSLRNSMQHPLSCPRLSSVSVVYLSPRCQVNLGRFQAPVFVAQRTLVDFACKGYLLSAACLVQGLGLGSAKKGPEHPAAAASSSSQSGSAGPDAAAPAALTMKQQGQAPWDASAANQLQRAAQVFSSLENYWTQRLVVRVLYPTSQYHSELLALSQCVQNCQMSEQLWHYPSGALSSQFRMLWARLRMLPPSGHQCAAFVISRQ